MLKETFEKCWVPLTKQFYGGCTQCVPAVENLNKNHISRLSNIHLEKNTLKFFWYSSFFRMISLPEKEMC